MDSSKVKNKDAKIRFLEKICNYVGDWLGVTVDLKPSKVVAGLEAKKTCHFLQLFAVVVALNEQTNNFNSSKQEVDSPSSSRQAEKKAFDDIPSESKEGDANDSDLDELPLGNVDKKKEPEDDSPKQEDEMKDDASSSGNFINAMHDEENDIQNYSDGTRTQDKRSELTPRPNSGKNEEENLSPTGRNKEDTFRLSQQTEIEEKRDQDQSESKHDEADALPSTLDLDGGPPEHKESVVGELEKKKTSIEHLFFGTDEFQEETIDDEAKQSIRPKTARRRPPRIKERTSSEEKKSTIKVERPIIFKDDDNDVFDEENSTSTKKIEKSEHDRYVPLKPFCFVVLDFFFTTAKHYDRRLKQ